MNDSDNLRDLNPEQSWLKAEKMLDSHFRKKRMMVWTVSLSIVTCMVILSYIFINRSSEHVPSENINSPSPVSISGEKKANQASLLSGKEVRSTKSEAYSNDEKVNSYNETGTNTNPVLNHANRKPLKSGLPDQNISSASDHELKTTGRKYSMTKVKRPASPELNRNEEHKEHDLPWTSLADLVYLNPISISQIPIETNYDLNTSSGNQSANLTLPPKKFDLKVSLYGGAYIVSKNITSKDFSEYVNRRKNEEENIVAASMGASLSHSVKNFSLSIGFEYSSWGERNLYIPYVNKKSTVENGSYHDFDHVTVDTAYIWGNQWLVYDTIPDSTFISHLDTVTNKVFDASVYKGNSTNKFYFFEVPVEINYRFNHSKLSIGATIGISPAWLISKKGYYLDKDLGGLVLISELKSINTFQVNGRFSIDFYYRACERLNILFRPQVKANLNSVFQSEYDVAQRYYATGLIFGLQYSIR
jgi:hypothetical protein